VSEKQNPVILNEAQRSEEPFQEAKYFNFTTSQLHDFTTSQLPMFLRALKNAILSTHLSELCDRILAPRTSSLFNPKIFN
jgi:hypothetical protein